MSEGESAAVHPAYRLIIALRARADAELAAGAAAFMGWPDRWFEAHNHRCINDHTGTCVLRSEVRGSLCLACHETAYLTFPEDRDGPLEIP